MANKKKNVKSKTTSTRKKVTTKGKTTGTKPIEVKKIEEVSTKPLEKQIKKKSGINTLNTNSNKLITICIMIMAIILILSTFGSNIEKLFTKYDIKYDGENYVCRKEIVYEIPQGNMDYLDAYLKENYKSKEEAIKACENEETSITSKQGDNEEYCGFKKECEVVSETEESYNLLIKKIVCYSKCKLK